jgi:hypothetical protein
LPAIDHILANAKLYSDEAEQFRVGAWVGMRERLASFPP